MKLYLNIKAREIASKPVSLLVEKIIFKAALKKRK